MNSISSLPPIHFSSYTHVIEGVPLIVKAALEALAYQARSFQTFFKKKEVKDSHIIPLDQKDVHSFFSSPLNQNPLSHLLEYIGPKAAQVSKQFKQANEDRQIKNWIKIKAENKDEELAALIEQAEERFKTANQKIAFVFSQLIKRAKLLPASSQMLEQTKMLYRADSSRRLQEIAKWMQDTPLIIFLNHLANQLPAAQDFLNTLNTTEDKAFQIREGMKQNSAALLSIQNLNLSRQGLIVLPKEIGQLTNLQKLYLTKNQLTALPKEIGQLAKLQELYLFNNKLTSLPQEIGQLTNLQELYLFNNKLISLPQEIGQLTKLQKLDLSINQLIALPQEIGQLTNLQILGLSNNQLKALPQEIGQLVNLRILGFIAQ